MSMTLDSIRRGVDRYLGGRRAIGTRVVPDKADKVFQKELAGNTNHKLGVIDAVAIAAMCCEAGTPHCYDFAAHVAEECGGRFEPLADEPDEPQSPVQRITGVVHETSDITSQVIDAMADGIISDNELLAIEQEIAEAEEALRKLRKAARAVNAAGKPTAERGRGRGHVGLPVHTISAEAA